VALPAIEQKIWTYKFPFLPDLDLTENKRKALSLHYREYSKHSTDSREAWGWAFKEKRIPSFYPIDGRIRIDFTVYFESWAKAFDPDNTALAFKPAVDALVDIGVIKKDSGKYVSRISYGVEIDKNYPQRTTLTITREE